MDPELLTTLKALADASRLRLIGLLAARRMAVEELAQATGLSSPTVAHHLQRLRDAGLVTSRPRHPYVEYELRMDALHDIGRRLDAASRPGAAESLEEAGPDGKPRPAFEAKVLRAFIEDGRLVAIPAQEKKRLVLLRYLAETAFEPGTAYPEKEVNQRLGLVHPDVASLRRYLVDLHFMSRTKGVYRLEPATAWPS
ncbi:MAG TPA: metalloregulator ArsR/SmtB family transcription factor [Candidatus Limnocylindrales bacterium]|jgi:biotin operon repressor